MQELLLLRKYGEKATNGKIVGLEKTLFSVELPWKDNKNDVSCIPEATYVVEKVYNHKKYGNCFRIKNVPKRVGVLIHNANYSRQLLGCIAPGLTAADIDKDGILDVTSSVKALEYMFENLEDTFLLRIIEEKKYVPNA